MSSDGSTVRSVRGERARHNKETALRLATIVVIASAALLAQQLLAPDVPRGTDVDRAYIMIYIGGVIAAVLVLGLVLLTTPRFILRYGRTAWLGVGVIFVIFCTALSVIDITAGSEPIAYVIGLLVFGPTFRARRSFYFVLIAGSVVALIVAQLILTSEIDYDALVAVAIVAAFSIWLAISTERGRVETHYLREELAEQNRVLDRERSTDVLTGLMNRRAVTESLDRYFSLARRHGISVAVALIDLDYFKTINDKHGHAAGDLVLSSVARLLQTSFRDSDAVGRFGGEEFIVVMPYTELNHAIEVCERIRAGIESQKIDGGLRITGSIGVTVVDRDADDSGSITVSRADDALYEAKGSGRNKVVPATNGS